jgi:hypothetical protein
MKGSRQVQHNRLRKATRRTRSQVLFRQFWGVTKRSDLVQSLDVSNFPEQYAEIAPDRSTRYALRSAKVTAEYREWPGVDLFAELGPTLGVLDNRKDALIGHRPRGA